MILTLDTFYKGTNIGGGGGGGILEKSSRWIVTGAHEPDRLQMVI